MIFAVIAALGILVLLYLGAPFVPAHHSDLSQIFDALGPAQDRSFVDLGSGDGRVVKAAAERGYVAIGYELNPLLWLWSRVRLGSSATIRFRPLQSANLEQADVVFMFSTSWHLGRFDKSLPDRATIVIYGPQSVSLQSRPQTDCGSAIIYWPVAPDSQNRVA